MEQLNITDNVDTLFQSLQNFTQREGVIGKPVVQGEKTLLPVVSVTVGYGGGNASMNKNQGNSNSSGSGALGLGAKLSTEAVIVIDDQNVTMMPINSGAGQLMDKIPQIISGMNQNKQSQSQQSSHQHGQQSDQQSGNQQSDSQQQSGQPW